MADNELLRYAALLAAVSFLTRKKDMYIIRKREEVAEIGETQEILRSNNYDAKAYVINNKDSSHRLDRTIEEIKRIIVQGSRNPDVRLKAVELVQDCPSKDRRCEITKIFDFVKQKLHFISDTLDIETLIKPHRSLKLIEDGISGGDCDDHVILLGSMLRSIGIPIKLVLGSTGYIRGWHHIYLQAEVEQGKWVYLDPSLKAKKYIAGIEHEGIVKRKIIGF